MKKTRQLGYLFKEGVRNLFSHGFMSFAAICVTVACLIIIGTFSIMVYNLSVMVKEAEQENRILVFTDETYNTAEAKSVGSQINLLPNVNEAVFISREEALQSFVEQQGNGSSELYAGIDAEDLRDRFLVTLVDNSKMEETTQAIRQLKGVAYISERPEIAKGFETLQSVLNVASGAIIIILLIVSMFIISNTVKLAMYDRREEIGIMKMIGATNRFIRFPHEVEGFLIGVISAAVAFFLEWGIYTLLSTKIKSVDLINMVFFVPFEKVVWIMAATFGVTGLFVGVFGSVMSIRKFLNV